MRRNELEHSGHDRGGCAAGRGDGAGVLLRPVAGAGDRKRTGKRAEPLARGSEGRNGPRLRREPDRARRGGYDESGRWRGAPAAGDCGGAGQCAVCGAADRKGSRGADARGARLQRGRDPAL